MKEWKFYGRRWEINRVYKTMLYEDFIAFAVLGGRGYGKTRIVQEAAAQLPDDWTTVYMELPDATNRRENEAQFNEFVRKHYSKFRIGFEKTKYGHLLKEFDIPENGDGFFDAGKKGYQQLFDYLLSQPKTVLILDEAQNIDGTGLVPYLKMAIDERKLATNMKAASLIMAGSDQQLMHEILGETSPLAQRVRKFTLAPLSSRDLMKMGADQGWLERPRRFHAMYSALGGVPRLWEDFHSACRSEEFQDPELTHDAYQDDLNWQIAFIKWRINHLKESPETIYLNPKYVKLPQGGEAILDELVGTYPGISFGEIRNNLVKKEMGKKNTKKRINTVKQSLVDVGTYDNLEQADFPAIEEVFISLHEEINIQLSEVFHTLTQEMRIAAIYSQPQGYESVVLYDNQTYNDNTKFYITEPNVVFEITTKHLWQNKNHNSLNQIESEKDAIVIDQITDDQMKISEDMALESFVTSWFEFPGNNKYSVGTGIRLYNSSVAGRRSKAKAYARKLEIDLMIKWRRPNEEILEYRVVECNRSFSIDSISDATKNLKRKVSMVRKNWLKQLKKEYNLKGVLFVPHWDDFESIRKEIEAINAKNSKVHKVGLCDHFQLAKSLNLTISPFPVVNAVELNDENYDQSPEPL